MKGDYLGTVRMEDPLYGVLEESVLPTVGALASTRPIFDVFRLVTDCSNWSVFGYVERFTGVRIVGKFYGNKYLSSTEPTNRASRALLMRQEFAHLESFRARGFVAPPHGVVRPVATCESVNCVLIEEYASGTDLHEEVVRVAAGDDFGRLEERLRLVADFLAVVHGQTQSSAPLDRAQALASFRHAVSEVRSSGILSPDQDRRLLAYCDRWAASDALAQGLQTLIHGDAKPSHYIFSGPHHCVVVDFEHSRLGDPADDLGAMAAALKHLFLLRCGNRWKSEALIREFYAHYASRAEGGRIPLRELTTRGQFFMALWELRRCTNPMLTEDYRRRLLNEVESCVAI